MRFVASTPKEFKQWISVVRSAYFELTGSYVEADFNETTAPTMYENEQDETTAVRNLSRMSPQRGSRANLPRTEQFSMHDVFGAIDNAFREIGVT